jgi:hypothetical protein
MTNDTDITQEINVRLLRGEIWLSPGNVMIRLCLKFCSVESIGYSDRIRPMLSKI